MNALFVFSALSLLAACQAGLIGPQTGFYAAGYPAPYAHYSHAGLTPLAPIAPVPVAPAVPYVASNQFQAQDEFGNINYGYSNINSAKQEVGNAYGGVTGSYSYVDANGKHNVVNYIADHLGFRVEANNLPVAPVHTAVAPVHDAVAPVFDLEGPSPVEDTPEVKAAKAEFQAAFDEAKRRHKRDVSLLPLSYGYANAYGFPYAAPLHGYAYGHALPYTTGYAPYTQAAREATLTTVKLNPGHAVAYRVD